MPVDLGHPVYPFLRRLELEGRIAPGRLTILPIAKSEVVSMLAEAGRDSSLAGWEKSRLLAWSREFAPRESLDGVFKPLGFKDSSFRVDIHAESYNLGYISDSIPVARTYGFGVLTARAEGSYKDRLHFLSAANAGQERALHERMTENYDPRRGMPYNTDRTGKGGVPRTVGTFDGFRTLLGYEEGKVRLEAGADWNQWGPGIWQHAALSRTPWFWVNDSLPAEDSSAFPGTLRPGESRAGYRRPGETAPMTQMRLALRSGRFAYAKVVARRTGLWKDSLAYLVAHRLEWRPWDRLGLAIQELASIAGRPLDWTYVMPLVPLKYAEHELGDRDNIAVGIDADLLLPGRTRAYAELFVDDWSGWDLDFWGTKYAWTFGGEAAGYPLPGSLIQAEYSRVEAWTFTHRRVDAQLQHYGALIGSSLPANSHALHFAFEQALEPRLDLRLEYTFMQRDALSRGSSVFDWHDDVRDGRTKEFLGGVVETRHSVLASFTWRWRRFVEFRGAAGWLAVDDWKSREGESLSTPILSGELTLRY